jgi:hypothetical protein
MIHRKSARFLPLDRVKEAKLVVEQDRCHLSKFTTVSASGVLYSEFYLMKGKIRKAGFDEKFLKCAGAPKGSQIIMTGEKAGMNHITWEKVVPLLIDSLRKETEYLRENPEKWGILFLDGFDAHSPFSQIIKDFSS